MTASIHFHRMEIPPHRMKDLGVSQLLLCSPILNIILPLIIESLHPYSWSFLL